MPPRKQANGINEQPHLHTHVTPSGEADEQERATYNKSRPAVGFDYVNIPCERDCEISLHRICIASDMLCGRIDEKERYSSC
jgi:hypothetical protein